MSELVELKHSELLQFGLVWDFFFIIPTILNQRFLTALLLLFVYERYPVSDLRSFVFVFLNIAASID